MTGVTSPLGLSRLVESYYRLKPGSLRAPGIHPSQIYYDCPVLQWFRDEARSKLSSDNPADVKDGYSFLVADANAKEQNFSPSVKREFAIGHAIHTITQYQLGLVGKLWGRWRCDRCGYITGEQYMPRMKIPSIAGDPFWSPSPCERCRANLGKQFPWVYVEPKVRSAEWGIVGHCDGIIHDLKDGELIKYALEIKSAHLAKFNEESGFGVLPPPEHVQQASIYAWLLDIPRICFLYVCKNQPSKWKEIVVPMDDLAVQKTKDFITIARRNKVDKPPVHSRLCPDIMDQRARNCVACERCFGELPPKNFWEA